MRTVIRKNVLYLGATCVLTLFPLSALAQRTAANVVMQADDAFGSTVGDEKIGIYTTTNVRGFSPVSAGNIRVEGLSFDRPATFTGRLVSGNTIRIGISAQGYPFPAPTGIVDFTLRKPSNQAVASVGIAYGPLGGKSMEIDAQLPLDADRFGLTIGAGRYLDASAYGSESVTNAMALSARYAPNASVEIHPFWSRITYRDDEAQPLIFTQSGIAPPAITAGQFFGQQWTDTSGISDNYGLIVKGRFSGLDILAGGLRSIWRVNTTAADLLLNVDTRGRVGNRTVILQGDDQYAATSGEVRISRTMDEANRRHTVIAMLKTRKLLRDYGGAQTVNIPSSQIGEANPIPAPLRDQIANTAADRISQTTVGIAYQGKWLRMGELSVGVQRAHYKKTSSPTALFSSSTPTLVNANAAAYVTDHVAAYLGYTKGLEESPSAPLEAINRNESPPAIITAQKEAGLRWKAGDKIAIVLGVFDIEKPYFNLNVSRQFMRLGSVRHRGVEFSTTGKLAPNFTAVLGSLMMDRHVTSTTNNASGDVSASWMPIGAFRYQTFLNVNYVLSAQPAVSFTAAIENSSKRVSNTANNEFLPARTTVSLGARYKFKVGDKPALIRLRMDNIFNKFAWDITSSGAFIVNSPRRYTIDFGVDL